MTEEPNLPPLPESLRNLGAEGEMDAHEKEVLAYARQVVLMERERCAKIAASFATCGCNGTHGRCNEDDAPLAIAAAIREAP